MINIKKLRLSEYLIEKMDIRNDYYVYPVS